ncbi:non-ribosomal peptide synthetase [Pleionea sediminis]|uniref:non-ribosomal peptide synthetase n=1 Tax=Pleionea sediminis TaxID=2569479 RepID=UPI0011866A36|nr:non-ribosomal peptide synthetase [Pleionea sediminis]
MESKKYSDIFILTPIQEGMLFHAEKSGGQAYHVQSAWKIDGEIEIDALERAVGSVVQQHDALRMGVLWKGLPRPHQFVVKEVLSPFEYCDWRSTASIEDEWVSTKSKHYQTAFDLTKPPLMRLLLAQTDDQEYRLLWTGHHMMLDGWSVALIMGEIFKQYEINLKAIPATPNKTPQFKSYLQWLKKNRSKSNEASYWRRLLGECNKFEHIQATELSASIIEHSLSFTVEQTRLLKQLAIQTNTSLNTIVQLLWSSCLAQLFNSNQIVFGMTVSGRPHNLEGYASIAGMFINTLPVRVDFCWSKTVNDCLRDLQQQVIESTEYSHCPTSDIKRYLKLEEQGDLFDSILVFENYPVDNNSLDLQLSITELEFTQYSHYPLTVIVSEHNDSLNLILQVNSSEISETTANALISRLEMNAQCLVAQSNTSVLNLLSANYTPLTEDIEHYSDMVVASDMYSEFANYLNEKPDAVAIIDGQRRVSYQELNDIALNISLLLDQKGIQRGTHVAVKVQQGIEYIASLLALVRLGCAYVPLDTDLPTDRIKSIFNDSGCSCLIVFNQEQISHCSSIVNHCINIELVNKIEQAGTSSMLSITQVKPDDLACMVFTSGSTGKPKGVEITQRGILRLVKSTNYMEYSNELRFAQLSNLTFDAATWEIWGALLNGGNLVIVRKDTLLSPSKFQQTIKEEQINTALLTTALFNIYANDAPNIFQNFKYLVFGGEAGNVTAAQKILQNKFCGTLINAYGPAENTTLATTFSIPRAYEGKALPIGSSVSGSKTYVLDEFLSPVIGEQAGELYIAGPGLARGYANLPKETARAFIPNPWARGERLYRTGDLVKYNQQGELIYVGRNDSQVKLRGFRVEISEVENIIRTCHGVNSCCVVWEPNIGGGQLFAYIVNTIERQLVVSEITRKLPSFMKPSAVICMKELPITDNGKVDRRALPTVKPTDYKFELFSDVETDQVAENVLAIVKEIAGIDSLHIGDDFFASGGNSLTALRVLSKLMKEFKVDISISEFARQPTVHALANHIRNDHAEKSDNVEIKTVNINSPHQLSFSQKQLWFVSQLENVSSTYNIPLALHLAGEVDVNALQYAVEKIVAKHAILRTSYHQKDGEVFARACNTKPTLNRLDLSSSQQANNKKAIQNLVEAEMFTPFLLSQDLMARFSLIQVKPNESIFVISLHHIAADGWSLGVLVKELEFFYQSALVQREDDQKKHGINYMPVAAIPNAQQPEPLPKYQYADFALWQANYLSEDKKQKYASYWRERLIDGPIIHSLPTCRVRPPKPSYQGATVVHKLPNSLVEQLTKISQANQMTLFVTLFSRFAHWVSKLSGEHDVIIGTPVANREKEEFKNLVGCFVNILPVRFNFSKHSDSVETIKKNQRQFFADLEHQAMPFSMMVDELGVERSASFNPLFQIVFTLQNNQITSPELPDIAVKPYTDVRQATARMDLTVEAMTVDDGLEMSWEYSTDIFDQAMIETFARGFEQECREFLKRTLAATDSSINDNALVTSVSQDTQKFNDIVEPSYSNEKPVRLLSLLEQQVNCRPNAMAITSESEHFTYLELWEKSIQIALYLKRQGVTSGDRVVVQLPKNFECVATFIGVLKLYAIYVPLDCHLPSERVADIIQDCDACCVVTDDALANNVSLKSSSRCQIVDLNSLPATATIDWPWSVDNSADQIAYIMYTSGTTGRPKGVAILEQGITRLVKETNYLRFDDTIQTSLLSQIGFDASTFELWAPLLNGGICHIVNKKVPEPKNIRQLIHSGVNTLWLTSTLFNTLVDIDNTIFSGLKYLLVGGEAISVHHANRLAEISCPPQLINGYGPTENTTFSCTHPVTLPITSSHVSIGQAIKGTECLVLNDALEPVPHGVVGDLYLGGKGLAIGYWNNSRETAQSFIPHPEQVGERLYFTGDRVRVETDGNLSFIGRKDRQVKLRGFRVELKEIESVLLEFAPIKNAAIRLLDEQLIAFITSSLSVDLDLVNNHLYQRLPEYMIPTRILAIDSMPLTSNGKLDDSELRNLWSQRQQTDNPVIDDEMTATCSLVCRCAADILNLSEVTSTQSFFALGGNSLKAIKLQSDLENKFGVHMKVEDIFKKPVLKDIALLIDAALGKPKLKNKDVEMVEGEI